MAHYNRNVEGVHWNDRVIREVWCDTTKLKIFRFNTTTCTVKDECWRYTLKRLSDLRSLMSHHWSGNFPNQYSNWHGVIGILKVLKFFLSGLQSCQHNQKNHAHKQGITLYTVQVKLNPYGTFELIIINHVHKWYEKEYVWPEEYGFVKNESMYINKMINRNWFMNI